MKFIARKHKVQPCQIRQWRKNIQEISRLTADSPNKLSINKETKLENAELEQTVYTWILKQREAELAVSTRNSVDKAKSIDPIFRDGNQNKLMSWVYDFRKRGNLSVRTRTHKNQLTAAAMQSIKRDYCRRLMTSYNSYIRDPR